MPLHPAYFEKLQALKAADLPPIQDTPVEITRQMFRTMQPERTDIEIHSITEQTIPSDGVEVPIRIYRPSGEENLPVVMMYHGGGWVIGDLTSVDGQSREVCVGAQVIVVAVDYRLAPEHKFPTAAQDSYAALKWVFENITEYGGDPSRIAVAGDSAGGNLAAVVAQMSRDESGPVLCFQLLVYPVIDGTRFDTSSYLENAEGFMLTEQSMRWFWDLYASSDDRKNPYASPIYANSLANLPPALILTAEYDVLRDEGEVYGEKLKQAGVDVEIVRYDGFIHGFFAETATIPATRRAMAKACESLRAHLAG